MWTANTDWEPSTLRDVMSPEYSDDEDFLGSEFSKAFSLGFIDDDTVEADKIEPTNSLIDAIDGCSYDLDIASDMKNKNTPLTEVPIDTIVAIYDYSFSGIPKNTKIRNNLFTYRGSFEYQD
ncbi:immunity 22 family protein [Pseudomonas sp. GL-B-26]|uniref:immunity 22 family protein n=1 Tax=Pseudomonas sp. GL-B-26 TaxID=2832394 RepID=UPI001CBFF7A7|nr:immunity 22 family protein [Pseudomonas sp. GL-B-26]